MKKIKPIKAWAVYIDEICYAVRMFKPSIREWKKDSLNVPEAKIIEVEIRPITPMNPPQEGRSK